MPADKTQHQHLARLSAAETAAECR